MASFRKKGDVWYYRFVDANGKPVERAGCPDRKATEQMARDAETTAAKFRAGLVDPKQARYLRESKRLIGEHVGEFIQALEAKGSGRKHLGSTRTYIERVATLSRVERIADLTPTAVAVAITTLKGEGLSARAINAHVTALKAFSRWLRVDGRTPDHALESLCKRNEKADPRRRRRALSPDEARRLIQATEREPSRWGLSGPDRAMAYALALGTGFRLAELRSLTPERFDLEGDPPTVTILAGYSKNGKTAVQPLPESLAERLRPWLVAKTSSRPVFAGMTDRAGAMIRDDLRAADIEPATDSGVLDFHALRTSYISHLVASGASVKTCQTLARHSTATLTFDVYARASLHDVQGAVESLPDLASGPATPTALKATGTTDPIHRVNAVGSDLAHYLPIGETGSGRMATDGDGSGNSTCGESGNAKPLPEKGLDASHRMESDGAASASRRTRTFNPLIKSQPTDSRKPHDSGSFRVVGPELAHHLPIGAKIDPDLKRVVDAWPHLPKAIRRAVMALVDSTKAP